MSEQKKIDNRLEDLFKDLEDQATRFKTEKASIPGWTWECDPNGVFTQCSPEITEILGIQPEKVLGESLFTFLLSDRSKSTLDSVFETGSFPTDVELEYSNTNDELVNIVVHIFPIESIDDTHRGWRGFNSLVIEGEKAAEPVDEQSVEIDKVQEQISDQSIPFVSLDMTSEEDQVFTTDQPTPKIDVIEPPKRDTSYAETQEESAPSLSVPDDLREDTLGLLELLGDSPDQKWSNEDQKLVEQVANQLALALENARLFQETQVSLSRTEALYNIGQAAIGFENLEELLQGVVNTLTNVLPADKAQIAVFNIEKNQPLHYHISNSPPVEFSDSLYLEMMEGLTGWCVRERKPVLLSKGQIDPRASEAEKRTRTQEEIGSMIYAPLMYRDNTFGAIIVSNKSDQKDFTQPDVDLLVAMATQVATALANARLFQEEQRRRQMADTLSKTARVVGATLELEYVGNRLLDQLSEVIKFDKASLQIIEEDQRRLISGLIQIDQESHRVEPGLVTIPWEQSLVNSIIESKQPVVISNTQDDQRWPQPQLERQIRSWIGAPLLSGEDVIGLLILEHSEPDTYEEETADFISAIAAQVTAAIRNAGLFQQTQQRSVQLQTAAEVSRAASSILDPGPLIQQTVNLIQERFNSYYVGLFLVDTTGEWTNEPGRWAVLRAGTGEAGRIQIERRHKLEISGGSMISKCIRAGKALTPQTLTEDVSRYINPLLPKTRTEIALPLISRGNVIGAMSIQSEKENAFGSEDIAILQTMADQVANSLQNAYLFDQTQVRAEELAILNEMSRTLSEKLDVNTTLRNVYLYASRLIDTSTFLIVLHDEESNELSFPLATIENREVVIPPRKLGNGLIEYVINTHSSLLIKNNIQEWLQQNNIEFRQSGNPPQSWLGVPISVGGQNLGILCVQHQDPNRFTERHKDILVAIANQSAIALQNAQLFTQTQEALSETEALLRITSAASSSFEIQVTLSEVLNRVLNAIKSTAGIIAIVNVESNELELIAHKLPDGILDLLRQNGLKGSIFEWGYQQKKSFVLENLPMTEAVDTLEITSFGFVSLQGVPIEAKGNILGILSTFSQNRLTTNNNDLSLLQAVGQQIGVAVENAHLFEQIQEQAAELEILNEMSRTLSTQFNINDITETIRTYSSRLLEATEFFIALLDQRKNEIYFPYIFEYGKVLTTVASGVHDGLTDYIIKTKRPLLITDSVNRIMSDLGLEGSILTNNPETWMGVPLIIGDDILGAIVAQNSERSHAYTERHLELLTTISRQSATAIQSSRLFEATRRQTEDLAVLNEMSRVLTNIIDRKSILRTVYDYTSRIMDSSNFLIAIRQTGHEEMAIEYANQDGKEFTGYPNALNERLLNHILQTSEPLLFSDDLPSQFKNLGILDHTNGDLHFPKSWLGAPMMIGDNVLGVIALQSLTTPKSYDERHRDLLVAIASQTAISLQNANLFAQTQQQLENLTLIQETTSALSESLSVADVCNALLMRVAQSTNSDSSNLFILQGNSLICQAVFPESPNSQLEKGDIIQLEVYPELNEAIQKKESLVISHPDSKLDEITQQGLVSSGFGMNAVIPMVGSEGVLGVISLERNQPNATFSSQELNLVETLASQAVIAIENARLYEAQIETSEQLRELDQLKTQFLANMSHELRTPLNSIIGFSRVIMKGIDGPITELQKQDLSAIYNAGQHLLKMINDILDISKIDAGKMELSFEDADIVNIIESVMATGRGLVKDKPIELVTAIEDEIPVIKADSTRIRQVLLNLISNAAKFTKRGNITVTARNQIGEAGRPEIYVSVKDTGVGIPEKDREKLFEPFVQVDGSPTRATGGTGLGLSITRMLIELHNGTIGLESEVGHGSTFYFTLPVSQSFPSPSIVTGKKQILMIDDDPQIINLYQQYLSDSDYQIVRLHEPEKTLAFAREISPFAITMEVNYSNQDGWLIVKSLKSNPDTQQIPVIICSIKEDLNKGEEMGVVDYLIKPILKEDLIHALDKISAD